MNDDIRAGLVLFATFVGLLIWAKSSGHLDKILMGLAASIGIAAAACTMVFRLTLATLPIWGGAMILYWIFS